jgi:glutamate 5-kinase
MEPPAGCVGARGWRRAARSGHGVQWCDCRRHEAAGLESRARSEIHELQAAAAVGQMGLAQMYETKLREQGMGSAQVLLTHADLADRERYLNARSTLLTLLRLGRGSRDQ